MSDDCLKGFQAMAQRERVQAEGQWAPCIVDAELKIIKAKACGIAGQGHGRMVTLQTEAS